MRIFLLVFLLLTLSFSPLWAEAPQTNTKNIARQATASDSKSSSLKRQIPYGVAMLETPLAQWKEINALIDPADLEGSDEFFQEHWPHITLFFGFLADETDTIEAILSKFAKPVTYKITNISCFTGWKRDVVKLGIESADAQSLHDELKKLPHHKSYPNYNPHMTIAYVKSGAGKKYERVFDPPLTFQAYKVVFRTPTQKVNWLELPHTGEVQITQPSVGNVEQILAKPVETH